MVLASSGAVAVSRADHVETSRLSGANRYATAVTVSEYEFPTGADRVYLARGVDPLVDALAGGALTDGPVLLVPPTGTVPAVVTDEIARLAPTEVVALGGPAAISRATLTDAADDVATSRLSGANRYATAVTVSEYEFPTGADRVYLARGVDPLVDALAGGALTDGPVLLVPPTGTVPAVVTDEIARLAPTEVVALGGPAAISQATLTDAADDVEPPSSFPTLTRISRDTDHGVGTSQISGDGRWIYYTDKRPDPVDDIVWEFFLWRVDTETLERTRIPTPASWDSIYGYPALVDVNDNGRWLVFTSSELGHPAVLDAQDGSVELLPVSDDISPISADISADGRYVLTTDGYDGRLVLWDRQQEELTELLDADSAVPQLYHLSNSGLLVAYQSVTNGARETAVYDHATGLHEPVPGIDLVPAEVEGCCLDGFSGDGTTLSMNGYLVDVATGALREVARASDIEDVESGYFRSVLNADASVGIWWTQGPKRGWWHMDTASLSSVYMEETLDGSSPSNGPSDADLSDSGRRVAILSSRPNMVLGDDDPYSDDVFMWDRGPDD
nr:cell wall-binding repeat-containing protein [Salsipaludibacter albus]